MNQNNTTDINKTINHPLGKKPSLSQKQLKTLRMVLQQLTIPEGIFFYNLANKQSNWGFSSNQRFVILNVKQKSLGYLSKLPQGYLPFDRYEQILPHQSKQKIIITEVKNFKCLPVKGKISSLTIEWDDKQQKRHTWIWTMGSSKLMNDWVGVINSIANNTFDQEKYDSMSKINKATVNQPNPNQIVNPPLMVNDNTNQPIGKQNQLVHPNEYGKKQQEQPNKFLNPNSKIQNSPSGSRIYSQQSSNQQYPNSNYIPANEQVDMRKKPVIPKINQTRKPQDEQVEYYNNAYRNESMSSFEDPNNKSGHRLGSTKNIGHNNLVSSKMESAQFNNPHLENYNDQYLVGHSRKVQNQNNENHVTRHKQPVDFVEQLKLKKQTNPSRFDLTNELSQKKFHQYDANNSDYNYSRNNTSQSNFQRKPTQKFLNRQNSGEKRIGLDRQLSPSQSSKQITRNQVNRFNDATDEGRVYNKPERSHIDNHNENNYDQYELNYNETYKPASNFPESTKNLSKIRSDYLMRKAQNEDGHHQYPQTSKNHGHILDEYDDRNNRVNRHNQNSIQRRQESGSNLNKANSNYVIKGDQQKFWNQVWLETSNPNKKIEIYQQFVQRSKILCKQIIQQLPLKQKFRQYQAADINNNIHTYLIENITISVHIFENMESINGSEDNINPDAPVLYDQSSYDQLKREFYNYNLILGVTNNQGFIKIPLCCYFQYRGILTVCKADIPQNYKSIQPYRYKDQFQALQNIIKVRFLFENFNVFENTQYRGSQGKFIVLSNLKNLIPGIPNSLKQESSYFRKEFLLQYDEILEDLQSSSEAHVFSERHIVSELLSKLESLEIQIVHTSDLMKEVHKTGLSLSYLPLMYQTTNSIYLKRIFMSQIVVCIFTSVIRSELNHAFSILPAQNMHNISNEQLNDIIVDCAHVLINQLFSYSLRAQNIWKIIVQQANKRYQMIVSKEDILPGYLLSGIVHKINLNCDFKLKSFNKSKSFFVSENSIPREIFFNFQIHVRRYDMQAISPTYAKCKQIIENDDLTTQSYQHLVTILNLKQRNGFNDYFRPIIQQLKTYLGNFISYTEEREYQNLDVYEYLYEEPITYNSVKSSFLAIKWLIKNNEIERANQIFEIKFHELGYWIGEYNSAITQFYDFFSMFYASIGDYQESICLAKSSLINVHKILGQQALPVADKHYQLGNIYFKIGRKNQALKQYNKTKAVLQNHHKTTIPEYGIILLKIALLYLNFGQLIQCLSNAIEAEKIFQQSNGANQNEEIECFEILARVYQITKKATDMQNLCEACSKSFNLTQNPKILERMLKIVLYPKLSTLSTQEQRSLTQILLKLQEHSHNGYLQTFNYLHKKAQQVSLKKKINQFLQNIVLLTDEVNRRDLIRKHVSMPNQSGGEAEEMLAIFQALGILIGYNFMVGSMKDTYYE